MGAAPRTRPAVQLKVISVAGLIVTAWVYSPTVEVPTSVTDQIQLPLAQSGDDGASQPSGAAVVTPVPQITFQVARVTPVNARPVAAELPLLVAPKQGPPLP